MGRLTEVRAGRVRAHPRPAWDKAPGATWSSGYLKEPLAGEVRIGPLGVEGDEQFDRANHGGPHRAVLACASEHYPLWREELGMPEIGPGGLAENLVVEGFDERRVAIGDVWRVGSVTLELSQPRGPCANIARRWDRPDLLDRVRASGRTGWYLRVLEPGTVRAGDEIATLAGPHREWTVARVLALRLDPDPDPAALAAIAACPALSPEWRERFAAKRDAAR